MAGSFTTAEANLILDERFKDRAVYGVLHTASPTDTGSVANEVANLYSYTRTVGAFTVGAAARAIANSAALLFPAASGGDFGTITHLSYAITNTYGNPIFAWGPLTVSKLIEDGDQLNFATGNITATFAAGTG